ncbi:hypothetical protein G9A89_004421 [Geosiphon pyriformis]|nr:hypothetical protein G9A89_004421 [Geosiphon pyriformis]
MSDDKEDISVCRSTVHQELLSHLPGSFSSCCIPPAQYATEAVYQLPDLMISYACMGSTFATGCLSEYQLESRQPTPVLALHLSDYLWSMLVRYRGCLPVARLDDNLRLYGLHICVITYGRCLEELLSHLPGSFSSCCIPPVHHLPGSFSSCCIPPLQYATEAVYQLPDLMISYACMPSARKFQLLLYSSFAVRYRGCLPVARLDDNLRLYGLHICVITYGRCLEELLSHLPGSFSSCCIPPVQKFQLLLYSSCAVRYRGCLPVARLDDILRLYGLHICVITYGRCLTVSTYFEDTRHPDWSVYDALNYVSEHSKLYPEDMPSILEEVKNKICSLNHQPNILDHAKNKAGIIIANFDKIIENAQIQDWLRMINKEVATEARLKRQLEKGAKMLPAKRQAVESSHGGFDKDENNSGSSYHPEGSKHAELGEIEDISTELGPEIFQEIKNAIESVRNDPLGHLSPMYYLILDLRPPSMGSFQFRAVQ